MSKRGSLFASRSASSADAPTQPSPSSPGPREPNKPVRARTREGKRNVTAYLEPEAFRQLKLLALTEDAAVQELLVEGINEVFAKRGLSRIA